MPRYAIGDIQGCYEPLRVLLRKLKFSADRDQLYFVGDLVNRGPQSLQVLRFVRSLGAGAQTVLGNHDLHLLALRHDPSRQPKAGDTLQEVLAAPDCDDLLEWLIHLPLLIDEPEHGDVLVHAGLLPQWTIAEALRHARSASAALLANPREFLRAMYGNQPDCWNDASSAAERHRFTINALTRMRYCRADGRINLKLKDAPGSSHEWLPWFDLPARRSPKQRVIFGHWSTLGLVQRTDLLSLDTGCVWGGALTAVNLDDPEARAVQIPCAACQQPGND